MERIAQAVDHKAYGVLHHIGRWYVAEKQTVPVEQEAGMDRRIARWTCHTHVDGRIVRTCLRERLDIMREGGYTGVWGIEQTTQGSEYNEMAWMLSELVRALE
jgi:hypothetical protein